MGGLIPCVLMQRDFDMWSQYLQSINNNKSSKKFMQFSSFVWLILLILLSNTTFSADRDRLFLGEI